MFLILYVTVGVCDVLVFVLVFGNCLVTVLTVCGVFACSSLCGCSCSLGVCVLVLVDLCWCLCLDGSVFLF